MNEQTTDTREEVAVYPLSEKQITSDILDSARKAIASHTVGMGRSLIDTAHLYAAYCIIRERQLRASLLACKKAEASNREKDAEIERLQTLQNENYKRATQLGHELASLRESVGEKPEDAFERGQLEMRALISNEIIRRSKLSTDIYKETRKGEAEFVLTLKTKDYITPPTKDKE